MSKEENLDLKIIRKKLLTLGYIEIKLYADASIAYLMKPNKLGRDYDICLASYEFDYDIEDALLRLFKLALKKGLFDEQRS